MRRGIPALRHLLHKPVHDIPYEQYALCPKDVARIWQTYGRRDQLFPRPSPPMVNHPPTGVWGCAGGRPLRARTPLGALCLAHTRHHTHANASTHIGITPTCASPPTPQAQRSTSASCCGPTHATETPNGSHNSIRAQGHAPMASTPARPREQNSRAPPTHHHTPTKLQAKRETQDGRVCPPAHMHPPAHASAPAAVRTQSQRARPSLLRPSTSQHESPPHLCSAAHPSHIPLAPEGRAIADSQAYASDGTRLNRPSERKVSYTTVAGSIGNEEGRGKGSGYSNR